MIFWILFIAAEIWRNWYLIKRKKIKPNYAGSFMIRAFFAIAALAIMNQTFDLGRLRSWYEVLPDIGFLATSFYLLFDPILNKLRGLDIDYRGKESGWIDPLLTRTTWWILKGACAVYLVLYFLLR